MPEETGRFEWVTRVARLVFVGTLALLIISLMASVAMVVLTLTRPAGDPEAGTIGGTESMLWVVLVTADLLKLPRDMAWRTKLWAERTLGLPGAALIINLSHTHAAPALFPQTCYPQWGLDVDYVVPGHGDVCTKQELYVQRAFIMEWETALAVALAKGWSKEEAKAKIDFKARFNVDIGQEYMLDHVIDHNVDALYARLSAPMVPPVK